MSQENVEIVRQYFLAYDRGGWDALAEFWHRDINWRAAEGALDDVGLMEGPDALRHYYEQWEDTFDTMRAEVEELVDARRPGRRRRTRDRADEGERGRGRPPLRDRLLDSGRQDRRGARVPHSRGSPRSCRSVGVALWTRSGYFALHEAIRIPGASPIPPGDSRGLPLGGVLASLTRRCRLRGDPDHA